MVGPGGRVYAIDINADAVANLNEQAKIEGLRNLSAEVKEAEAAIACEGCADIVFFGIDLHDFADPEQVIRNAKRMLRPSGRLIDLDWKDIPMDFGPPGRKTVPGCKGKKPDRICRLYGPVRAGRRAVPLPDHRQPVTPGQKNRLFRPGCTGRVPGFFKNPVPSGKNI